MSAGQSNGDTRAFAPIEWMLAGRYLRARRKEGFISVIAGFSFLGIMLGVATLIIVMAVMNGFRAELYNKVLGLNGHMVVNRLDGRMEDYEALAKRIAAVPGVVHVAPLIEGQVMVSSDFASKGALVRGISEKGIKGLKMVAGNLRFGTLDGFDKGYGIAVGIRLAGDHGVNVGKLLTLIQPRGKTTIVGTVPNIKRYPIVAVFELGMAEYDKTMIFMPLGEAKKYFSRGRAVDVVEIMVEDPQSVQELTRPVQAAAGPGINLIDWRQRNQAFFDVLKVERVTMFLILSLIILVAAFNIISGMMMLVKDKGRDIAVLRTMGATKGAVMRVFLITGASIGVIGTLAGFLLGVAFTLNIEKIRGFVAWATSTEIFNSDIYFLTKLPAKMDPSETMFIVFMGLALSVLATIYPSWRASKLDPVEALRYE